MNQNVFDSYGAPQPQKPSKFLLNETINVFLLKTKYRGYETSKEHKRTIESNLKEYLFLQFLVYIEVTRQEF